MQKSYTIFQELTFKEFFISTLYLTSSTKIVKRLIVFVCIVSLLNLFLTYNLSKVQPGILTAIGCFLPIVYFIGLAILLCLVICLYIYSTKQYLFRDVSYDFTHWGVVRNGFKTDFSKPWRDISKVKETGQYFFLFVGKIDFHIIQKRMINQNDLTEFRIFLTDNMKK